LRRHYEPGAERAKQSQFAGQDLVPSIPVVYSAPGARNKANFRAGTQNWDAPGQALRPGEAG
jgi:hypothetical protein